MHEVLTSQYAIICVRQFVIENILYFTQLIQQINQPQPLKLLSEQLVGLQQRYHFDVDAIEIGVRGLQANDCLLLWLNLIVLFAKHHLHIPHALECGHHGQLKKALQLQVLQEDKVFTTHCKYRFSCDLAFAEAVRFSVQLYLLLYAHLRESINH